MTDGYYRLPPGQEALPNAPTPEKCTVLMKERSGGCFAFARFQTPIGQIQIALRGKRIHRHDALPGMAICEDRIEVTAHGRGHQIGRVAFDRHGFESGKHPIDPCRWSSYGTNVDPAFRRQGVASCMYGMMKACGFELLPSFTLSEAGAALWHKLQPHFPRPGPLQDAAICTDQALIERCAQEFEPWSGLERRLADCTTLEQIAALSPAAAAFVSACHSVPNWPSREMEAVRLLRDTTPLSHRYNSLDSTLKIAGFSRSQIWMHFFLSRVNRSPISPLLAARAKAVRELDDLDRQSLLGFHDFGEENRRWAAQQPADRGPVEICCPNPTRTERLGSLRGPRQWGDRI
ncbi:hypothetical protein D3C72_791280 [compost metagenome]